MFSAGPRNIGIACGPSGLLVVDEDRPGALAGYVAEIGQAIPPTLTISTGRGRHYYFRAPEGVALGNAVGALKGRGIDIRGSGGYVIGPGSLHETGALYLPVDPDAAILPAPAWLIEALQTTPSAVLPLSTPQRPPIHRSYTSELERALARNTGDRSADFAAVVGACKRAGLTPDETTSLLISMQHPAVEKYNGRLIAEVDRFWWKASEKRERHTSNRPRSRDEQPTTRTPLETDTSEETRTVGREMHRGQLRMAERLTAQHANTLRYAHGLGWLIWDGTRWAPDADGGAMRAAIDTVKAAIYELAELEGDARKQLMRDISRTESAAGLEGMLRIATALRPIAVSAPQLDADPYLFNTPGGTVDLRSGEIRPNNRSDLITKVAGAPITGEHNAEWEAFITRILPDPDVRAFVQRLFGYAMLGKVTEHVMPIFTGTGANGKGTLRDAIISAFGDYAIEVDPALLMESKHERHGAFKMRLRGARIAFCSETEKGRRFAEATMKRLVGGDPIEANLMHKNPITFLPSHTLIMLTNHLPKVSGDDPAIWRRILVVPFDVVIPKEEQDIELPDRLRAASGAVLSWVYQGWLDYQEQGLNPPEAVRVCTQEYQQSSDTLGRFLEEQTITNPHMWVRARELYQRWCEWCVQNGEQATSEVAFAESMRTRGFEKRSRNVGRVYIGLGLVTNSEAGESS